MNLSREQRVNKAILVTGLLAALAAAPAQGAAPYPPSTAITGLTWDAATYTYGALGGDIWPVTWHGDGTLHGAYGDGQIDCPAKVSYGVVSIPSDTPSLAGLQGVGCGPTGTGKGKLLVLGSDGASLYTQRAPQGSMTGSPLMRSVDGGKTWVQGPSFTFFEAYVNFGRGNEGAPGGYLYVLDDVGTSLRLGRVPPAQWNVSTAYQWFSGTADAPAWTSSRSRAKAIFADPGGMHRPRLQWVPGLRRFLLTASHSEDHEPGQVGVFESESLWGPWRTVHYVDDWLGLGSRGKYYSIDFSVKWQSSDGGTLWATFSCHNAGESGACGKYHDRLNLMRVTLILGG
jgi:hypothetical protein